MSAEGTTTNPSTTTVLAKPWYESKTLWVNVIGLVILMLGIILDAQDALLLPPQALAWLGVLLAVANGMMRFATNLPLASGSGQTAEVPAPPAAPPADPTDPEWSKPT